MTAHLDALLTRARAADICVHTLEVSVGGRLITTSAAAPFAPSTPHRVYSVSKTLTAVAVLLLAEEGRIDVAAPITTYFPEFPDAPSWTAATTVDDMLGMRGPHSRTTYDEAGDDWLASYFRTAPTHRPGTLFTYDTSGSYVLSALVERYADMPLLEYLRPRLLEPLGVGAGARFLPGPEGISHGGSGLIMAPRDLLLIAETLNADGLHQGRRIVSERVVRGLLEPRSSPALQAWGAGLRADYGRQIWLPYPGAWMMFGLGGQIVFGDPARELAVVVTADTTALAAGDQRLVDLLLDAVDGLVGDIDDAPPAVLHHLTVPHPTHRPANARVLDVELDLVGGEDAPHRLTVDVGADGGVVRWDAAGELVFSTAEATTARLALGDAALAAGWSAPGVLDLRVSAVADDIASLRVRLVVTDDGILTCQSQGFGPAVPPGLTWRGSYRVVSSPRAH